MSDLAPFVAATLRDKVIADMKEENDALREQVRKSRTVAITGPSGTPVYCQAQLDEGEYDANPNLWRVNFGTPLLPCPLAAFSDVELRVGGICKAKVYNNAEYETYADDGHGLDGDGFGELSFYFTGPSELWLQVQFGPFASEEVFGELAEAIDVNEPFHITVADDFAPEHPGTFARFSYVSFVARSINGAIQSLSLDLAVEEDAQRRREELNEEIMQQRREYDEQNDE